MNLPKELPMAVEVRSAMVVLNHPTKAQVMSLYWAHDPRARRSIGWVAWFESGRHMALTLTNSMWVAASITYPFTSGMKLLNAGVLSFTGAQFSTKTQPRRLRWMKAHPFYDDFTINGPTKYKQW